MAAPNPNPARITDELWRFAGACLALEPGSDDVNAGTITDKPGYHGTRAWNQKYAPGNYSIRDAEDLGGPHDKTAAFDWTFRSAQAGNYDRIMIYAGRLLRSGQDPDDPRGNGLREFYGQADKDTAVEGWDFRYVGPRTSDASHLWHIHFSFDRDKVNDRATFDAVLSILKGETVAQWRAGGATTQEDDMARRVRSGAGDGSIYLVPGWQAPSGLWAAYGLDGPTNARYEYLPLDQLPAGMSVGAAGLYDVTLGHWNAADPPKPPAASPVDVAALAKTLLPDLVQALTVAAREGTATALNGAQVTATIDTGK